MAGHSQFKNIMYRKGAQDAKRAKQFTKIAREITVAAKENGTDAHTNPRLRLAMQKARSMNMPKDNVDRAIKRASGTDTDHYEEVRYEGYGPGGAAIIVEALTDNRNRTGGAVRAAFSKHGGALGESGSVTFTFERVGQILYPVDAISAERVLEAAIEAGALDCVSDENAHTIITEFEGLGAVAKNLEENFSAPQEVGVIWKPMNGVSLDEEKATKIMKLISVLEDDDDVQNVYSNFEVSAEIAEKISGAQN